MKAWIEILKLGRLLSIMSKVNQFYRGNVIKVLKKDGFFNYFDVPRRLNEISEHFGYVDKEFLKELLNILVVDKSLFQLDDDLYGHVSSLDESWIEPEVMTKSMREVWISYAEALPARLRGKYIQFSGGLDLYNWDDSLVSTAYEQMRRAAFAYSDALTRSGRFLDIGCGNGYGTARIWAYYHNQGYFDGSLKHIKISALDINPSFLNLAKAEFKRNVAKAIGTSPEEIEGLSNNIPEFFQATMENIPKEDNTFDVTYASQILHWANPEAAISEILRVTKPGGLFFGTQMFLDNVNPFVRLHTLVIEGANGHFTKDQFIRWAKAAGAKKVSISTPISVFKVIKG